MKTESAKKEDVEKTRRFYVVDAKGQVLGRLASRIAHVLRGKHQVFYTPHVDTGDFVIVVNAKEIAVTGNKEDGKVYHTHSGWTGSVTSKTVSDLRKQSPEKLVEKAVWGMLPKNTLGRAMLGKLKVYAGDTHPHAAQQPLPFPMAI